MMMFKSHRTASNGIIVTGTTLTDQLNVGDGSTFTSDANFDGNIDVDGHTELDDLNVTGVSTFQNSVTISGAKYFNNYWSIKLSS